MEIELRLEGKKVKLTVREDGTFLVGTPAGMREPTKAEKIAVGAHVAAAARQLAESQKTQAKIKSDIQGNS